uniref:Phlebovirus_G2 domain-containing protein n=1 Tax=Heterorhabditis bacteriophora TaxID=37862 RepID=A0A1I7XFT4_HETBA
MFYKVAHVPLTESPYEVFSCMSWNENIDLTITYTFNKYSTKEQFQIKPYEQAQGKWNTTIQVASINVAYPPIMDSTFASSSDSTIIIPDTNGIPVECSTLREAIGNFSRCPTKELCSCLSNGNNINCKCPEMQLEKQHNQLMSVLPITTPELTLIRSGTDILAKINTYELTVVSVQYIFHHYPDVTNAWKDQKQKPRANQKSLPSSNCIAAQGLSH